MPFNPLDLLKKAGSFATTPIVPKSAIQPAQDMLDSPSLERSPMEARMRGFGAGALEGLRGMTTPLDVAGLVGGGAMGMMGRGAKAMGKVINPGLDLIESVPVRQIAPAIDDVNSLIGDMQRNLARVPNRRPTMETLGERAAEFTPTGGEGLYNVGKTQPSLPSGDAFEGLLNQLGGRQGASIVPRGRERMGSRWPQ